MLVLKNLCKEYREDGTVNKALQAVNIEFKDHEFVSVIGPSGSGKTTLLHIIGGMDVFSDGDMLINGKSVRGYSNADWNAYRNKSLGFVFQDTNLIAGQTVLSNVELALTLSGTAKEKRRKRAVDALRQVGFEDTSMNKKPAQLSCGQRQLAAIARALVNDPDILLADEPTSCLDAETGKRIMELFRELSETKLVIAAGSNPDSFKGYAARTVTLAGGIVADDSNPFHIVVEKPAVHNNRRLKKGKKETIHILSAFAAAGRTVASRKVNTVLHAFAGSVGILGIAFTSGILWRGKASKMPVPLIVFTLALSIVMAGIFTYVSVLKKRRYISILRGLGASGRDIFRIISAEAVIYGFASGMIGVAGIMILSAPLTGSVRLLTASNTMWIILISILINLLAGCIPSGIAAAKKPAAALDDG